MCGDVPPVAATKERCAVGVFFSQLTAFLTYHTVHPVKIHRVFLGHSQLYDHHHSQF